MTYVILSYVILNDGTSRTAYDACNNSCSVVKVRDQGGNLLTWLQHLNVKTSKRRYRRRYVVVVTSS